VLHGVNALDFSSRNRHIFSPGKPGQVNLPPNHHQTHVALKCQFPLFVILSSPLVPHNTLSLVWFCRLLIVVFGTHTHNTHTCRSQLILTLCRSNALNIHPDPMNGCLRLFNPQHTITYHRRWKLTLYSSYRASSNLS
jgi:hypothetical protein